MYTRKQYLEESREPGSFARYYGEIVMANGGPRTFNLPVPVATIVKALADGDEHLNSIPLGRWDAFAVPVPARAAAALRERGDYPTLGNAVCILKQAARMLADEVA